MCLCAPEPGLDRRHYFDVVVISVEVVISPLWTPCTCLIPRGVTKVRALSHVQTGCDGRVGSLDERLLSWSASTPLDSRFLDAHRRTERGGTRGSGTWTTDD